MAQTNLPTTNVLHIWHRFKHDDFTVTEVRTTDLPSIWIADAKKRGGFLTLNQNFIMWHCITYIEINRGR